MNPQLSVVIATRNRAGELRACLASLSQLPEAPAIVVVDNDSTDDSVEVARGFEGVTVIEAGANLAAAARNLGVGAVSTPYVAFCDDDATWEPGSLEKATEILASWPDIGLVAPAIIVEHERLDDVSALMAESPLGHHPSGHRLVLGFLACAAVFRRQAFLEAGGFAPWLFIGGEEALLSLDMAKAGWKLVYAPELLAHHVPSPTRDPERHRIRLRNHLWVTWARRRPWSALRITLEHLAVSCRDRDSREALISALGSLAPVLSRREAISRELEAELELLDRQLRRS